MPEQVSKELSEKLRHLLGEAMDHAVAALHQLLGVPVEAEGNNMAFHRADAGFQVVGEDHNYSAMVLTEIMGQVNGASFLLIEKEEESKIGQLCSQALGMPYESASEEMKKGILLELDNILSAAFITKLANYLGVSMYGGVPSLVSRQHNEIAQLVGEIERQNKVVLTYEASLRAASAAVSPVFLWVMEENFIRKLEEKQRSDS